MSRAKTRRVPTDSPRLLLIPAAIALLFLGLPLVALVARAPWPTLFDRLTSPVARDALLLSVGCATSATVLCLFFGVPLAWVLARSDGFWSRCARGLVIIPLVLPPVIGGVALLLAFGRSGVIGQQLYALTGTGLPFSTAAVVIAETFVALPFVVLTVEGSLRSANPGYLQTAASLGASPWTALRRVTLPMIGPAVAAGSILAFARALGEFGATITFAGNLPGVTQTLPLAVYSAIESDQADAVALSMILVAFSILVLVLARGRWIGWIMPRRRGHAPASVASAEAAR